MERKSSRRLLSRRSRAATWDLPFSIFNIFLALDFVCHPSRFFNWFITYVCTSANLIGQRRSARNRLGCDPHLQVSRLRWWFRDVARSRQSIKDSSLRDFAPSPFIQNSKWDSNHAFRLVLRSFAKSRHIKSVQNLDGFWCWDSNHAFRCV
jgi:hypothetical protein